MPAGLTSNTLGRLLRNLSGALTVDGVAMGSYEEGDVSFTPEFEYDAPTLAGGLGIFEDSEFVIAASGTLAIRMKEAHYAALSVYYGDMNVDSSGASEHIGGAALTVRPVVDDVVFDGVIRGDGVTNQNVKIVIDQAVVAPPPLNFSAKTSAGFDVAFEARYDITAPTTYPCHIYLEKP